MTFKDLLVRLFLVGVFLAVVIPAHLYLDSDEGVADVAEKLFASDPYSPPSDDLAHRVGRGAHKNLVDAANQQLKESNECIAKTSEYLRYYVCKNPPAAVEPWSDARMAAHGHSLFRGLYVKEEVEPHYEKAKTTITVAFGILYAVIGLTTLRLLLKWFAFQALPVIRSRARRLKDAAPIPSNLKVAAANRKLRKAESAFATVKNLYDNGLITEEAFLKRKAELAAALGKNELLRTEETAAR